MARCRDGGSSFRRSVDQRHHDGGTARRNHGRAVHRRCAPDRRQSGAQTIRAGAGRRGGVGVKQSGNNPKVLALLAVLVIAAIYVLLLKPQGADLSSLQDEEARVQQSVDDGLVVLGQLDRESEDEGAGAQELAAGVAVPPSPELSQLLRS